ncbi:hypothetical protein DFS34DRAFT_648880 [Phlyctochytrium arcticum]|nr:hypothetical protein DFS34DRAFT_648880 [Phlyctochytrium arcticum]
MTLPEVCEDVSNQFRTCVDNENLWGRLQGRCDGLKEAFESCLRREYVRRKRRSLKSSKEARQKWEEASAELGYDHLNK